MRIFKNLMCKQCPRSNEPYIVSCVSHASEQSELPPAWNGGLGITHGGRMDEDSFFIFFFLLHLNARDGSKDITNIRQVLTTETQLQPQEGFF